MNPVDFKSHYTTCKCGEPMEYRTAKPDMCSTCRKLADADRYEIPVRREQVLRAMRKYRFKNRIMRSRVAEVLRGVRRAK